MTKEAWAHNEWLRRYIQEPSRFMTEFQQCSGFVRATSADTTPSYGENCASYMATLVAEAPEDEAVRARSFDGFNPEW